MNKIICAASCRHTSWVWNVYSCSVTCNNCGKVLPAEVSQAEDGHYIVKPRLK
jgi:ribosomal protein S27E